MLRQRGRGPGSAVFHGYHGDSLGVKVAALRRDFESVRIVAVVSAAGIDDLDGAGGRIARDVPFDVGFALVLLGIRHLAFRPDGFLPVNGAVLVGGKALHQRGFRGHLPEITHLGHELHGAAETEGTVLPVGIEMQLGRHSHPAQLPVNQG